MHASPSASLRTRLDYNDRTIQLIEDIIRHWEIWDPLTLSQACRSESNARGSSAACHCATALVITAGICGAVISGMYFYFFPFLCLAFTCYHVHVLGSGCLTYIKCTLDAMYLSQSPLGEGRPYIHMVQYSLCIYLLRGLSDELHNPRSQ